MGVSNCMEWAIRAGLDVGYGSAYATVSRLVASFFSVSNRDKRKIKKIGRLTFLVARESPDEYESRCAKRELVEP